VPSPAFAAGVNDHGQIAGYYATSNGWAGFLYVNGVVTTFAYPTGSNFCPIFCDTYVAAINSSGQILGSVENPNTGLCMGFLYAKGAFTTFTIGNYACTTPNGFNDAGQVVGSVADDMGNLGPGFLYDVNTGATTFLPQSIYVPWAINGDGLIAASSSISGGLLYNAATGASTLLAFVPVGVSNNLEMTGFFCSCIYDRNGNATPINYPNASYTSVGGINDLTQVVGTYSIASSSYAFVATPNQ
jgi:hypothetical protein